MDYFKIIHWMRDMQSELDLRQQAMDSGADSETLEEMNAELHRKLDLAELVYIKPRIQRPLQSTFPLFSQWQLKQCIEKHRNALKYTGIPCSTFHYYLDLPGYVVREKVLSFLIHHPQDLLNLIVAIPTEEKFSPLSKAELEFELEFPTMFDNGEDDEEFWDFDEFPLIDNQLRAFSLRSDNHRKVVLRHFEDFLVNDISNVEDFRCRWPVFRLTSIDSVVRYREGMALEDWEKFPTVSKVLMIIANGHVIDFNPEGSRLVGRSIWHVEMCIPRSSGDVLEPLWRKVCGRLSDMPNLRNLELHHNFKDEEFVDEDEEFGDEEEVGPQIEWIVPVQRPVQIERIDPIHLPELPFLKSLNFHAAEFNNADNFGMLRMLLEKYGGQLNQFCFTVSQPIDFGENYTRFRQFPVDLPLPPCKNLTLISFLDKSIHRGYWRSSSTMWHWQSCEMLLRFLSNFREAPLKKIKLVLNDSNPRWTLYRLLGYMGRTFGNSLEHLELQFGLGGSHRMDAPPLALLEGIQFPRLVHFAINLHASELLYKAVLRFPVLETLKVGKYLWHRRQNEAGWSKQFSGT